MNRIMATVLCGALCSPAWGQEGAATPGQDAETGDRGSAVVATYVGPRGLRLRKPEYPEDQIHGRQEGWVALNFMVDTEGKPFEISVAHAVGDEEFQDAAIRALKRSKFQPATLDGKSIESGANYAYSFEIKGRDSARRRFVYRFRKLMDAVEVGDRAAADEALADIEADNLYEYAFLEFARFERHRRWGSVHQQIAALHRAIGHDEATRHLPDDMFHDALRQLFALQLQIQDFGGALKTAERLYKLPLEQGLKESLDRAVGEIEALRDRDATVALEGLINDGTYSWHLNLFQSAFHIDQVDGRLAEIKLRCAGKFVGFVFDEDLVYRVSDRYMPCNLEVVGDPGTRFRVVQSPGEASAGGSG